jgi:fibronectin-binding autotransporter adhesin
MALRYWVGGTDNWNGTAGNKWSAAAPLSFTASCVGTALTTTGSPALVVGMTVFSSANVSLGTIVSGSVNSWVVSIGGSYASQTMTAATTGAAVPTSADDVFFNAASGAVVVTVSATANCLTLIFTNYTGTFTISNGITVTVFGTAITLGSGMTYDQTTTGILSTRGNQTSITITFATIPIPNLTLGKTTAGTGQTVTISGTIPTIKNLVITNGASNAGVTLTGTAIRITASLSNTLGAFSNSTGQIIFSGACTISSPASTSISGGFIVGSGSSLQMINDVTLQNGTVTFTGTGTLNPGTFTLFCPGVITFNTSTVTWYNVTLQATGQTYPLSSVLNISNNLTISTSGSGVGVSGGFTINVGGSLLQPSSNGIALGTSILNMLGTGLIDCSSIGNGTLNINCTGTYTIGSVTNPTLAVSSLAINLVGTSVAQVYSTTAHTLSTSGSLTLSTNNTPTGANIVGGSQITWGNISLLSNQANTLAHNTTALGNLTSASASLNGVGKTLFVAGNLSVTTIIGGTATIELNGAVNKTWGAGTYQNNVIVNKSGGATITVTGAVSWGAAGRTLNIITGNNLVLSAALSVVGGTVLVPTGGIISGTSNLVMAGTSTLDVATGITIPNLATSNTITVTLARTTVATNYSGISTGVTFTAAVGGTELRVNNIVSHSGGTTMGTNTTLRFMGGTFVSCTLTGAIVLNTGATLTGTGTAGAAFNLGSTTNFNLSAGTLVLPAISNSYRLGTGITFSGGSVTLNMGTNTIDYLYVGTTGLNSCNLTLGSNLIINKGCNTQYYGLRIVAGGFNVIFKESCMVGMGFTTSTSKMIYQGVPNGTGFRGTGYVTPSGSSGILTLTSVTSGSLSNVQMIHFPTVPGAGNNFISGCTTFNTTYTVALAQTVGSAGSPVDVYGYGAVADMGSPYMTTAPQGIYGIFEIDAGPNDVYYFGGKFNNTACELRYLSTNSGDFDGSKATVTGWVTGSSGTIDFQGQSSASKYINILTLGNNYNNLVTLKSNLYVNDFNALLGSGAFQSGGTFSLYVMRDCSISNDSTRIMQPTVRLVGPLAGTLACQTLFGNLAIAKDSGAVVTVSSLNMGYATPTTLTYTAGVVNFGATTATFNGPVSVINPASVGNFSFNNVTIAAGITITITELMNITGTLALSGSTTFAGTHGWTCGTLTCSTPGATITLREAITYTTRNSVTMLGTDASRILMRTSDTIAPIVLAKWTLENTPASQSMVFVSATAIDSSAGMTIYSFQGTTNGIDALTINWGSGSGPATKSFTFVC